MNFLIKSLAGFENCFALLACSFCTLCFIIFDWQEILKTKPEFNLSIFFHLRKEPFWMIEIDFTRSFPFIHENMRGKALSNGMENCHNRKRKNKISFAHRVDIRFFRNHRQLSSLPSSCWVESSCCCCCWKSNWRHLVVVLANYDLAADRSDLAVSRGSYDLVADRLDSVVSPSNLAVSRGNCDLVADRFSEWT